jgi:hypothetical protein
MARRHEITACRQAAAATRSWLEVGGGLFSVLAGGSYVRSIGQEMLRDGLRWLLDR